MKKTLVAFAALALVGAASAQSNASVSGKFGFAYGAYNYTNTSGVITLVKRNGFEVTDGNVTFAASEDLGGGMKAGVSMDVRVRGRGVAASGTVDGRDAYVYLSGGFGELKAGAVDAPERHVGGRNRVGRGVGHGTLGGGRGRK